MCDHKRFVACVIVCIAVPVALACGPDFPWQLLDNRKVTLAETPANSFAFEAVRLLPAPSDSLKAVENGDRYSDPPTIAPWVDETVMVDETTNLPMEQVGMVRQMRAASNGAEAFERGAALPAAIRLYTAGAVAFHKEELDQALARFHAVLDLPEDERIARLTWATFMLGRCYARTGEIEKASQAFQQTRALAIKGYPDPLGLAVGSFGAEAKLHLNVALSYTNTNSEFDPDHINDYAREMAKATHLYAEQAARGSRSGIISLRYVAEKLLYPPKLPSYPPDLVQMRLAAVVSDPLVQRLLVVYTLAFYEDSPSQSQTSAIDAVANTEPPPSLLVKLISAIEQNALQSSADVNQLAALAYRVGRYDLASQLVTKSAGPMASWVKAKLAIQKGDLTTAAALYAEAVKAFPTADGANTVEESNVRLLKGESSVLALARGDYVDALARLYPLAATYWGDVAYLAERVLTVDELKRFVDAHVPRQRTVKPNTVLDENGIEIIDDGPLWLSRSPNGQLRDLLARRLVREGRYAEALPYFHAAEDESFSDPEVKAHVTAYAAALQEAQHSWRASSQAQGWFNAAVLARKYGMEMMGYEAAPDFFAVGGAYDFGLGQSTLSEVLITDGERERFTANTHQATQRFHYRAVALHHINRAADLLPPRSQAFAAVLCRAGGWANGTPEGTAIYQRYVRQGAYVPWAARFGRDCPDPDFVAASRFAWQQRLRGVRSFARQHRWSIVVGGLGLVGMVVVLFAWRGPNIS